MQVIYADILFIINLYITYALLLFTCLLTRSTVKRSRLLLSSVISAVYSLIILVPSASDALIALSRIPALFFIIIVAFRKQKPKQLLKLYVSFITVNLLFAGLMLLLWYFISPSDMYYNSGIVYFNIGVSELLITTAVCYFILKGVHKLISFKTPSDTVFDLEIFVDGKSYYCKSLLDTGNMLKDTFSGLPVIVVNRKVLKCLSVPDITDIDSAYASTLRFRLVVCSTVSGEGVLPAFRPEKVRISTFKSRFETDRVVIAVTDRNLKNGIFGAILPCSLSFEQKEERGDNYAEKIN